MITGKNEKRRQTLSIGFLIISVLLIILLFIYKDKLNTYTANSIQMEAGSEIHRKVAAKIDSAFNYTKNGLSYELTFLEFGSKGCSACNRMETVMHEVQEKYPHQVKVVFINIRLPENLLFIKHFGISVIPTQVLLNKVGKVIFRHSGYISAEDLLQNFI